MKTFEYVVERRLWEDDDDTVNYLNDYLETMGMNGWELIEMQRSRIHTVGDLFIFKREVVPAPKPRKARAP